MAESKGPFIPALCKRCENLDLPCSKLALVKEVVGDVEITYCGIYAPHGTPPEDNIHLAAVASLDVTPPVQNKES